ncbi:acyl-CoA thioester hydrolase [Arthrobacter sp. B3I9]|uniref:acyl-CoA thioesterase n=1 Tax=Arthrobacter sp. B3I9 TaxID=3042270 RepID=UPI0027914500|nr:acyl-CoA thioesterase [Arthrobacter sp. B3I9]MDQ0850554.1 acyl-CoA thioester hydrolase [Arthrobacter sp. B3I9]
MAKVPIVFKSTHRVKFSELDPYNHVSTGRYATYYADHRMEGLRDYIGWDLETLGTLPFMVWVRRMEIDFLRPARGDQEITITSFVREFRGPDALIECAMVDSRGNNVSRCVMTLPTSTRKRVVRPTGRPTPWRCSSKTKPHEPIWCNGGV